MNIIFVHAFNIIQRKGTLRVLFCYVLSLSSHKTSLFPSHAIIIDPSLKSLFIPNRRTDGIHKIPFHTSSISTYAKILADAKLVESFAETLR